jgi:hypothetical protein
MEKADPYEVNAVLRTYKTQQGHTDFPALLKIPVDDRLPGLCETYGRKTIHMHITGAVTVAMEKINLKLAMNADQLFELGETIIDTSGEDQLAMEDLLLFLQDLVRGKAGKIYDRMDIPFFMELFENYRQERHEAYMDAKYERDQQYKALPINDRLTDMFPDSERNNMREALKNEMQLRANQENKSA